MPSSQLGRDLVQSPLYSHTSVRLEEEMSQVESQMVFCQGANREHHVQEEEG
jgi:hypothetical protein